MGGAILPPNLFLSKWINSCDHFFFTRVQIYTKDAECAETIEKSNFLFLVFEIWSFLYSKLVNFSLLFEYKVDHNSKTKHRKIDFKFVSAHCASFM